MVQLVAVYVLVLATAAILALGVALAAWMQREAAGAWSVVALMLGVTAWCGTEAAMWSSTTLAEQSLWLKLTYPAVSLTIVGLTVFALVIAERATWLTPRGIAFISAPHVVVGAMALLNPYKLFYAGFTIEHIGSYTHYVAQNGPLFWVYVGVAWGMALAALGVIVVAGVNAPPAKRTQTWIVLVGSLVPLIVSVLNQFSRVQIEGIESTAFFITGVIFLTALIRGRLLDPSGHMVTAQNVLDGQRRELELRTTNRELGNELRASRHHADRLYDQATHDPLTNLSNRRALEDDLVREVARATRASGPIAFLLFDLDNFKPINDTFSHLAGDVALKMTSEALLRGSRQEDIICRWGGDEFLVVMPGAHEEIACRRAEELRDEIVSTLIRFDGAEFSVSASIGVSMFPAHGATSDLAILAADRALYLAKEAGGNRVAVADSTGPRLCTSDC